MYKEKPTLVLTNKGGLVMKSGNYLSSQQYPASTFGVKELNFCVRNGNRWNLFAIITAMVISITVCYGKQYTSFRPYLHPFTKAL